MKKILEWIIILFLLCISGCISLRKGEAKDIETRVLGIDASIPIPFAQSVNIMNIRLGWVEARYIHIYKSEYKSEAEQELKYLGKAHRKTFLKGNKK